MGKKTADTAEEIVKKWFEETYGKPPVRNPHKKGKGFDLQSEDGQVIIEVKGSQRRKLSEIQFRMLTDDEFKEAQSCQKKGKKYQLHLVTGIDNKNGTHKEHYVVEVDYVVQNGKSKIVYELPLGKKSVQQATKDGLIEII